MAKRVFSREFKLEAVKLVQDRGVDVFDYIERFYNTKRQHSTIGYLSPTQFEQQVQLA